MHQHSHRRERLTLIKTQYFDTKIVRSIGVHSNHSMSVDDLTPVDGEIDCILFITNIYRPEIITGLIRRDSDFSYHLADEIRFFITERC